MTEEIFKKLDNVEHYLRNSIFKIAKFIGKSGFSILMYTFICMIYLSIYHVLGFERTLLILLIGIFNSGIVKYAIGKKE